MKLFLLFVPIFCLSPAFAQQPGETSKTSRDRKEISAEILLPLGDFSSTHSYGTSIAFTAVHGKKNKKVLLPFTWRGSMGFFTGQKETAGGYPYRYPAYLVLSAGAGVSYQPSQKISLQVTVGPGLGRYQTSTRFLMNGRSSLCYTIGKNFLAGPSLNWMKETGANALWAAGLDVRYAFGKK